MRIPEDNNPQVSPERFSVRLNHLTIRGVEGQPVATSGAGTYCWASRHRSCRWLTRRRHHNQLSHFGFPGILHTIAASPFEITIAWNYSAASHGIRTGQCADFAHFEVRETQFNASIHAAHFLLE